MLIALESLEVYLLLERPVSIVSYLVTIMVFFALECGPTDVAEVTLLTLVEVLRENLLIGFTVRAL
jgi:hypothetical protein